MMTDIEYTDAAGNLCPKCEGDNVEGVDGMQVDSGVAIQGVKCNDCEATWDDLYTLTGYSIDQGIKDRESGLQVLQCILAVFK